MEKILFSLLLILGLANAKAAVEFDLVKGVDLTATNAVTTALLNQLVDSGTVSATNKGVIIRFSGGGGSRWPNVTDNPRYTNFLWLDLNTAPGTLKQYTCCGDVYTNWVISTVTPGSITTVEILNYTITDADLATNSVSDFAIKASAVSGNKIADNGIIAGKIGPSAVGQGAYAFGSIVGGNITNKTITATNIADNTITGLQIANDAIGTAAITNGAVTTDKIAITNITRTLIRDDAIGTLQITNSAVTSNKIASATINNSLLNTNTSYGIAKAFAYVDSAGTLVKGFNIASSVQVTSGDYTLTFAAGFAPSSTNYLVVANAVGTSSRFITITTNTTTAVSYKISSDGGADSDNPAMIVIYDF